MKMRTVNSTVESMAPCTEQTVKNIIVNIPFSIIDMRKALSRDVEQISVIPLKHPIRPEDLE